MEIPAPQLSDVSSVFESAEERHILLKYGAAAWVSYKRHGFFWWLDKESPKPGFEAVCFRCGGVGNFMMCREEMDRLELDTCLSPDILMAFSLDNLFQRFEHAGCNHWILRKQAGVPCPIPGLHEVTEELANDREGYKINRLVDIEKARTFLLTEKYRDRHERRHGV